MSSVRFAWFCHEVIKMLSTHQCTALLWNSSKTTASSEKKSSENTLCASNALEVSNLFKLINWIFISNLAFWRRRCIQLLPFWWLEINISQHNAAKAAKHWNKLTQVSKHFGRSVSPLFRISPVFFSLCWQQLLRKKLYQTHLIASSVAFQLLTFIGQFFLFKISVDFEFQCISISNSVSM